MGRFFHIAGILSILSGSAGIVSFALLLAGGRSPLLPVLVSPPDIVGWYARPLVQASVFLSTLSVVCLFPAVVGMGFSLGGRSRTVGILGGAAGVLGGLMLLVQNTLEVGLIRASTGYWSCTIPAPREAFAVYLENMDEFFSFPALIFTGLFYALMALGFSRTGGDGRRAGWAFSLEVLAFVLTLVFYALQMEVPANAGLMAQVLLVGMAYALAGLVMIRK